jgi:hypothetical protein
MQITPFAPLTLRIGITGHRTNKLKNADKAALASVVSGIYQKIFSGLEVVKNDSRAVKIYDLSRNPLLRIISSLAEGSDRICIDKSVVGGEFELASILPFTKEEYEKDFNAGNSLENPESGTVSGYNECLSLAGYGTDQSRVLELALERSSESAAYRTCGEYLVDHSDIVLAIFDGEHNDLGGTSAVVQQAQRLSVPVIVVNPANPEDVRLISCDEFSNETCEDKFDSESLEKVLRRELLFEELFDNVSENSTKEIENRFQQYLKEDNLNFDQEKKPDLAYSGPINIAKPFARFIPPLFSWIKFSLSTKSRVARKLTSWNTDTTLPTDHAADQSSFEDSHSTHKFYAAFLRADRLATGYATVHRSIFVWIYVLGAFALLTAAFALLANIDPYAKTLQLACVLFELALLSGIFILYATDHRHHYHQKWLEYRSLAEVLRSQVYLSLVGSNIDMKSLHNLEDIVGMDEIGIGGPGKSWMYLYTETLIRWSGFNGGRMDQNRIVQTGSFVRDVWLKEQQSYHTKNAAVMQCMEDGLSKIGYWSFWLTVAVVLTKLGTKVFHIDTAWIKHTLSYLAAALPVFGTTTFGIRNHAEFEISAQRSLVRRVFFGQRLKRLDALDRRCTLKELTDELQEISSSAINETSEWLQIYEVKESETA